MALTKEQQYYVRVMPAAKAVQAKTNIPAELLAAWWSWETGFSGNTGSKHNNHAGIKSMSRGKDYTIGIYAGYNSIENFAKDVARIYNLKGLGYEGVLAAARSNAGYEAITRAHNASKWSEADYNVSTIVSRARAAAAVSGLASPGIESGKVPVPAIICPSCHLPVPRH